MSQINISNKKINNNTSIEEIKCFLDKIFESMYMNSLIDCSYLGKIFKILENMNNLKKYGLVFDFKDLIFSIYNCEKIRLGWWTNSFFHWTDDVKIFSSNNSSISSNYNGSSPFGSHTTQMNLMQLVSEIIGIRFCDFETFEEFQKQIYYICKHNENYAKLVIETFNINIGAKDYLNVGDDYFDPHEDFINRIKKIFVELLLVRIKRYNIFIHKKNEIKFCLKEKVPIEVVRIIMEFLGPISLIDVACKHCLKKKKSIDVALTHSTLQCNQGIHGCVKCKISGQPQHIYKYHNTANCDIKIGCVYCSYHGKPSSVFSSHIITECLYLDDSKICCDNSSKYKYCLECKDSGQVSRIFKSHKVNSCKKLHYCVYCISLDKHPKIYNSHILSDCKRYKKDKILLDSYKKKKNSKYNINKETFICYIDPNKYIKREQLELCENSYIDVCTWCREIYCICG